MEFIGFVMVKFINSFFDLGEGFYSKTRIDPFESPKLIHFNGELANDIGLSIAPEDVPVYFSGGAKLKGSKIYSTIYSGHQFGSYVPQLGDGRAHFLGEVENKNGQTYELQLKGSGKTPYSRFGDGKAVLRSSLREYLISEAMYNLGIPTTRALCIIGSDENVERESVEKAAMVTRVSPTFVRFGHFEYFTYSKQPEKTKILADYVIDKFYSITDKKKYHKFYYEVVSRTAKLMAKWQAFGFAHGVMNTDNMSILGLTIDYGPYGFMDSFDPAFIPNSSDHTGRYSYKNQPSIGLWNLQALAYALEPVLKTKEAFEILEIYKDILTDEYNDLMRGKLGLKSQSSNDISLITELLQTIYDNGVDYTIFFRKLCDYRAGGDNVEILSMFERQPEIKSWFEKYDKRLRKENWSELNRDEERFYKARAAKMRKHNPKYILRNYIVQNAITMAEKGDYSETEKLMRLFSKPFDEQPEFENYASLPPQWSKSLKVSCSS